MQRPRHTDNRCVVQKSRNRLDVEGRRHHDDTQIGASEPRLTREREAKIGMNASLVKLVEDDRGEIRQERILLEPRRQDPFGDDEQPRVAGGSLLESDVPAHFTPERPFPLFRNTPRNRARGHAARLQQNERTRVDQGWRNPGGLARAGRRREHHSAPARERVADVRDVLVNDQRGERSQRPQRRRSRAPREARGRPDRGRGNADRLRRDRSSCRRTGCGCAIDR